MRGPNSKCHLDANMISVVALLWLCCFSSADAGPLEQKNDVDEKLLEDVLLSLERVVNFFGEDFSGINMDGLYGLRICQGRVIECLQDCESDDFICPPEVVDRLKVVSEKLETMTAKALPYVQEETPGYAFKYIHNIEAPFHVKYIPEWLGDNTGPVGKDRDYDGSVGDICFSGVMGTAFNEERGLYPKCTIDEPCWNIMTKPNTYDYYITHQLLYFVYGEASGCTPIQEEILKEFNGGSVRDMERNLCGRILSEAKWLSKKGTVDESKRDLFIEQSLICGLLGFQDFFSEDWMRMVIGWQTSNGCWTSPLYVGQLQRHKALEKLLNILRNKGRKLLNETLMSGDCLAHESGLGAGVLGVYMRYLIQELYKYE